MIEWNKIELKWRELWIENKVFEPEINKKEKKFITVAYPYPNSPQHVGHGRTYTITDIHSRFFRMNGFNVLFPMGFHYTGTPILSISKQIQKNDKSVINAFNKLYKIPTDIILKFVEPIKIAKYFHQEIKTGMIEMGYSIDWSREFTTIDPVYKKFIEWQFQRLKNKKLIIQGSHPVGWCPNDQNPVSQHDTIGDVEPNFLEYIMIKFTYEEYILPAATLRPETIFGVTNLWINPELTYEIVKVFNEKWIVSSECANKLKYLDMGLEYIGRINGDRLLFKKIRTIQGDEIFTLPAKFVKSETGTGIVMSVPAHAPLDYQALEDIKKDNKNISIVKTIANEIKPVIVINGYGNMYDKKIPSKEIINKLHIQDQNDPKLLNATKELYKKEFHHGKLNESCGKFVGKNISDVKDPIKKWILDNKNGKILFELTESTKCRCGTKCVVKLLNNQWFLDYSNKNWKNETIKHIKSMCIFPNEIRSEFDHVIDWLKEKACARKQGLGTALPWDKNWIIESLSDSTMYMPYYIIAKYVNNKKITAKNISTIFFDYILLGIGSIKNVVERCNIPENTLNEIRNEFLYFYPVDYRHSGRDLVPNHLTFFIMNHVAIFPKKYLPKCIVVNGSILMNGKKMSKSMHNTIPLRGAIKEYGADPIRLSIIISSELLQDTDFNLKLIKTIQYKLESIFKKCSIYKPGIIEATSIEDRWFQSRFIIVISKVTESIKKMRLREALHMILFDFDSDINWYLRRMHAKQKFGTNGIIHKFLLIRVLMLSPFAPHIAEEMWEKLGNSKMISEYKWPSVAYKFDEKAVCTENFLKSIVSDINNIIKVTKIVPKKIIIYTANTSKSITYRYILENAINGENNVKKLIKLTISNYEIGDLKNNINIIKKMVIDILSDSINERLVKSRMKEFDEHEVISSELSSLLKHEFGVRLNVFSESDANKYDPHDKARNARPFKPAILIE